MRLRKEERTRAKDGLALALFLSKNDVKINYLLFKKQNIQANSLRIYNMSRGVKTPNSPGFISTVHNEARFNNLRLKLIPARMKARPARSAKSEEYRKAKVAMRYGSKYKTLGVQRQALYLRILSPAKSRLSREARREILDKTLKLFNTCKE